MKQTPILSVLLFLTLVYTHTQAHTYTKYKILKFRTSNGRLLSKTRKKLMGFPNRKSISKLKHH